MRVLSRHAQFSRALKYVISRNSSYFDWIFGHKARDAGQIFQNYATEASFELKNNVFKCYKLEKGPEETITISKEDALKFYTQMQTIRRLENAAGSLYKEKIVRGFCHLYNGQEAVAVGFRSAMRPQDHAITAYRCHGWSFLMGIPIESIIAELTGRKSGSQRGKGGSMHMYAKNYYGGNGIVGAQVPLGTGVAFACKYKGDRGMCIACYGDGAANQGQIFEAYNIACLWKLPMIYICENNNYGMGTQAERSSCSTEYYKRGGYIPGIWVNGMNILAVRSAAIYAIEYATTVGPLVVEFDTYRYSGHSMSDPGTSYRTREEVQKVRGQRDPIEVFKALCIEANILTEDECKATDVKIKKDIDEAVKKAKADTEIELKELYADIYAANLEPKIRDRLGYTGTHIQLNKPFNI